MAVGTYSLQEGGTRAGELLLLSAAEQRLRITLRKACSGIFDLKWAPERVNGALWLGQADAGGGARIWRVGGAEAAEEAAAMRGTSSGMSLSLDWSGAERVAVSHSTRDLSVFRVRPDGAATEELHWAPHEHEVWVTVWHRAQPDALLSGSDDCTLRLWDVRARPERAQVTKRGGAGFTAAQFSPHSEHVVAVGSYDEHLYLWDTRAWARPLLTSEALGGGVWRCKWHPADPRRMLLGHMHSGFSALRLAADLAAVEARVTHTAPHASLAYGADWRRDGSVAGCCSFYDKKCSLWTPAFP